MMAAAAANNGTVLRLLGPAWTRTFRCVWMLEELLEQGGQAGSSSSSSTKTFRYEIVEKAKPISRHVKAYNSTGKVPVLLVYHNDNSSGSGSDEASNDRQPDLILSESSAINTYLADRFGGMELGLIPPPLGVLATEQTQSTQQLQQGSTDERAIYDMLVSCITTELDAQALWIHRKHEAMAEHFGRIPHAVAHAKQHFVRINQHLCTTYLQRPPPAKPVPAATPLQVSTPTGTSAVHARHSRPRLYLMGNAFTAVDILYVHCLDWSRAIGWESTWASMESNDDDSEDNEHVTTPYLTLQSYLERCHDRPAYQRAKQLRDAIRKDSTQNNSTPTTAKL